MNVNPETSLPPDADTATSDGADAPAKPVRKRRTTKAVEAEVGVMATEAAEAPAVEAAPKPKRRRAAVIAAPAADGVAVEAVPAEARRQRASRNTGMVKPIRLQSTRLKACR